MSSGVLWSRRSSFVPYLTSARFFGNSRRGATMVMVACALPALVCLGALAVDQGTLAVAAQKVQQTADVAALACASELPTADSAALCLQQIIEANNEGSQMQVWSDPAQDVTWYVPGEQVPGHGVLASGEYAVRVVAHSQVHHTLGRAVGLTETTITRSAVAKVYARGLLSDGFIFAGETASDKIGFRLDGSSITVNGTVQSNSAVQIEGADNSVTGDIGYSYSFTNVCQNFSLGGQVTDTGTAPPPMGLTWDDYAVQNWDYVTGGLWLGSCWTSLPSGRWKINGNLVIDANNFKCSDALFVVTGNVVINGSNTTLDRVTIVAKGPIVINGLGFSHSPFIDDLFAMSEYASPTYGILVIGAKANSSGILFAPYGKIHYHGYQVGTYSVAFVGRTISLGGSYAMFDGSGYEGAKNLRAVQLVG